eukprot:TRINITY_DN7250_c0_g1_i4.p1 TRINITY_DN7250_c0_g1~~TRINITY_DN7250_c0_g1_i4.p1  ORF type:complete len:134 (+),score=39.03 TRINITY_DN7250_c0_g1_i4:630-1031(+)
MCDADKDTAVAEALDAYDEVLAAQDVLCGHVKEGLAGVLRARMTLEMTEATDLSSDYYPETAEARTRVFGNKHGELVAKPIHKVRNPATYFARAPDALAEPQAHFLKAVEAACKLAHLRDDLSRKAAAYREIR